MEHYEFSPLGDSGMIVNMGEEIDRKTLEKVTALSAYLEEHPFDGMTEYVPGFTTVAVFYDPIKIYNQSINEFPYEAVVKTLKQILSKLSTRKQSESRVVDIPVCYGGKFGPDLKEVANHAGLTPEEVVRIHSGTEYMVYMIGFAPGFPYLGGMDERLAVPRRPSPRVSIPVGSVGIGGKQTGVYPIESPGGWQLIGKTPIKLFRPEEDQPSLLRAGDVVRFQPISREEFERLEVGD
ncbi:5-oxoprolinase subunit PxpB [Fictibacillus gelatini]|uniref:5-oxoprolinase subunit PxpB n=1 Tax=Fictibacillus gelatini TaxID=225985 RepID=UPI00041F5016|nr:5-oxoprolinase subunit PxpB [Fictibacillus gelatini]